MSEVYSNIAGIIGDMFSLGVGPQKMTITVNGNRVVINKEIRLEGGLGIQSDKTPAEPNDMVTLQFFNEQFDAFKEDIDKLIPDDLSRFSEGLNYMATPVVVTPNDLEDGTMVSMGTVNAGKFIDRIILEVETPFSLAERNVGEISIGTLVNPTAFMEKKNLAEITSTIAVDIYKTLATNTDIYLYFYRTVEPEPEPPYTQEVFYSHEGVSHTIGSDGNGDVFNIELTGIGLTGEINNTDLFGNSIVGNYLDFGINLELTPGKTYKIVQENSCLALFPDDPSITHTEQGVYTKTKEYLFPEEEAEEGFIYWFLMGQRDTNTYTHIYVYDPESETPDTAIKAYHIHNNLAYADEPVQYLASLAELNNGNNPYGYPDCNINVAEDSENTFTITVNADAATSHREDLLSMYPNLPDAKYTVLYVPYTPVNAYTVTQINPALAGARDDVEESDGVYSLSYEVTPENTDTIFIPVPLGEDKSHDIELLFMDNVTNTTIAYSIENGVTFVEPTEPEEPPTEPEEPPVEEETGAIRVRVLSF